MLTEWSTYDQLATALAKARNYGETSRRNQKVQRALKRGATDVYHRVNTPKDKIPVLYHFVNDKRETWFTFVLLAGSEGESIAVNAVFDNPTDIIVIHSHAVNRYMQRSTFEGTLEEAQRTVLAGILISCPSKDSDTYYIPFGNGLFLCHEKDRVMHIRTYVGDRQLKPNQRLWKRKSQNDTIEQLEQLVKEIEETINQASY